jgi:hypothetical protein
MQLYHSFYPEEPSSLTNQVKFLRRQDLSPETRHKIATESLLFSRRGTITKLSRRYGVSRQFVYDLRGQLLAAVGDTFAPPVPKAAPDEGARWLLGMSVMLQLRLVGRCSISAISELLRFLGTGHASAGFVSAALQNLGAALPCMLDWKGSVFYASDELFFLGKQPILVTVDPRSGAILRMEALPCLTKEAWAGHWGALRQQGILPLGLVADEGWLLRAARLEAMDGVHWQPDSFHAVAHRLGVVGKRLLRKAETAIEEEYKRQALLQGPGEGKLAAKTRHKWAAACEQCRQTIDTSDNFHFLYRCILAQFNVFDHNGQPRPRQKAEAEVRAAVELMRTLPVAGLDKELDDLCKVLPHLFNFLDQAAAASLELAPLTGQMERPFWTAAWNSLKKAQKSKIYAAQAYHREQAQGFLDLLQDHYKDDGDEFCQRKARVFARLDTIVQSSAIVETINSIIRPFLDQARDQVSQQTLNLIMFYHNHRLFKRGKRKGQAPIEILTGKKLEQPWLETLLGIAAKI